VATLKGLKVLAEDTSQIKIAIGVSLPGLSMPSHGGTDSSPLSPDVVEAND
jgi:hypothetical protein